MTWIETSPGLEELDGIAWSNATVHKRWEPHKAQTRSTFRFPGGDPHIERCACGAFGPAPWHRIDRWPSRKERKRRTNLPEERWADKLERIMVEI